MNSLSLQNKHYDNYFGQQTNLRQTGIEIIGDVPWGTHFCQFYKTKQDLLDILIPYFKAGLKNNELCIWVTSEFLTAQEAMAAMKKIIPGFSNYLKKGQIEIFPSTEWYLKGGIFEMKRVLNDWVTKHDYALKKGYEGLRVSGNPFWIDNKKDWDDFAAYEAEINNVIYMYKLLVLCTYSLKKCVSEEILDVVSNHEFALIKRRRKWENIESVGHKKMEEALRKSEKRYRSLMDNMLEGCQIIDSNWRYIYLNDSASFHSHLNKNDLIGHTLMEKYPGIEKTEVFKYLKRCMVKRKPHRMENYFVYPDNTKIWYELSIEPIPEGIFVLSLDITERKKVEEKLKELNYQKDEFISIASHELKTPISSIKIMSQLASKKLTKSNDKSTLDLVNRIEGQVEKLTSLVGDLLDASRIQSGKLDLKKDKFELVELIKEVISDITTTYETEKPFSIEFKTKQKIIINADRFRLTQVLSNLFTNAIKYSPEGGKINVNVKKKNNAIEVSVTDYGIGIPKEKQDLIFNRFYQAERQKDKENRFSSLGLGLYISSNIIKQHGGKIWVESDRGKGSTFFFTLPIN